MPKVEPKNCWEFWNCAEDIKKKCPAYNYNSGRDCWLAASSFREPGCPKVKNEFESCSDCPWFKKLNPKF
ncbi:MAG: hypothetical protein KJ955_08015 [Nanoarchaeota archaeon]|nr:hypothetical protein [Nanoarchaeota archaeon]